MVRDHSRSFRLLRPPASEVPSTGEEKFNSWVLHLSNLHRNELAPITRLGDSPSTSRLSTPGSPARVVDDPLRGDYFEYPAILRGSLSQHIRDQLDKHLVGDLR